jgi:hypothetical protein
LEQHPLGQVIALHTAPVQAPPTHSAVPHGGYIPHRQAPSLEQLSALLALHELQTLPAVPQLVNDGVLQVPEQQPLGQEAAVQATLVQVPVEEHCWPWGQGWLPLHSHLPSMQLLERRSQAVQITPPRPQLASEDAVQTPLEQHPLGQLVTSQVTQTPLVHR